MSRVSILLLMLAASGAIGGTIPWTPYAADRVDDYCGTNAAFYTLYVVGDDRAIEIRDWRSSLKEPTDADMRADATAHAAMESKRAARAEAELDAREQSVAAMRDLKRDIAATIDGLQTNVTVSAFPAGAQRQEFRDLADYVTDLAREVQRLRRREAENERGK